MLKNVSYASISRLPRSQTKRNKQNVKQNVAFYRKWCLAFFSDVYFSPLFLSDNGNNQMIGHYLLFDNISACMELH